MANFYIYTEHLFISSFNCVHFEEGFHSGLLINLVIKVLCLSPFSHNKSLNRVELNHNVFKLYGVATTTGYNKLKIFISKYCLTRVIEDIDSSYLVHKTSITTTLSFQI